MVQHSPDAEATVIELADDSTFVIRPDGSPVSYHTWNGPRAVRVAVFRDNEHQHPRGLDSIAGQRADLPIKANDLL